MKKHNMNFDESLNKAKKITKNADLREAILYEYDTSKDINKNVKSADKNELLIDVPQYEKGEFLTESINF